MRGSAPLTSPPSRADLCFATADADEARDRVRSTFADHDLRVDGRGLAFSLDVAPFPRLRMGYMTYGGQVLLTAPPMRSWYHVNLPVAGRSSVAQDGRRVDLAGGEGGVMMAPEAPLEIGWSADAVQFAIRLPRDVLEAHAAKLSGSHMNETIRFDLGFDTSAPSGRALLSTVSFLQTELARPGGLGAAPSACREFEAALMTQLLLLVPSQFSSALRTERRSRGGRARIRELIDAIDAHPEAETTTADLAARAGVGARALHVAFQDLVGMPPMTYVRCVRLDRVHDELAGGTARSVTDVAADWGFFHPGRFARQYRERFGELPSETARWARPGRH
jgi:AraC-like DNA-binding protein